MTISRIGIVEDLPRWNAATGPLPNNNIRHTRAWNLAAHPPPPRGWSITSISITGTMTYQYGGGTSRFIVELSLGGVIVPLWDSGVLPAIGAATSTPIVGEYSGGSFDMSWSDTLVILASTEFNGAGNAAYDSQGFLGVVPMSVRLFGSLI